MDPWKELSALEDGRNLARRWAALEGKSRTMSDDLFRESLFHSREKSRGAPLNFVVHVGALAVELWRLMRSG
jgi:hypothetical protein